MNQAMADFRKRKDSIIERKDTNPPEEDLKDLKQQLKNEIKVQKKIQKIEHKDQNLLSGGKQSSFTSEFVDSQVSPPDVISSKKEET